MGRILDLVFDLILVAVAGRVLTSAFSGVFGSKRTSASASGPGGNSQAKKTTREGTTARDPICGMFVSTELSHKLNAGGKTLHFCSEECLERYRKSATA
ncbi:MAG: YHS domain-containing protein [Acidobacteriota bacterium]|nr:YHS domain-containing protein [Acidobacteriota bacterium]